MKIAIQGHPTRGQEVIQILESLGTKNILDHTGSNEDWYYMRDDSLCPEKLIITSADEMFLKQHGYKLYTLEEFEKEFPFKIGDEVIFPVTIGWWSGIITSLTYMEDKLKYEVNTRTHGYQYIEPHKLSLYPMKKERNITLTLDKAKEWYKKGGELKEVALQAFTEGELNPLPRSWEEFCEKCPVKLGETYVDGSSRFITSSLKTRHFLYNKNICPSKKSAEAHLAVIQLEQLRNCWWNDWKPNWNDNQQTKYCIIHSQEFKIHILYTTRRFLSFPTMEMAEEFLKCFRNLIEQAGDLI